MKQWTFKACYLFFVASSLFVACAGRLEGYAPTYLPVRDERPFFEAGQELPYASVVRDPASYRHELMAWFGVVKKMVPLEDGRVRVLLSWHRHRSRHLCENQSDRSCRVTIHHKSAGMFWAVWEPDPTDFSPGPNRIVPGSLLKVYGKLDCPAGASGQPVCTRIDGDYPVVVVTYLRHFPKGQYVTTLAAGQMRR